MLGLFGIPDGTRGDVQLFWPNQVTGATTAWQIWTKPVGRSWLGIWMLSGGGGGGGGAGAAAGAGKGGGGGGGGSGLSRYVFPMWLLPETLYVLVGHGGTGGTAGASGNGGTGASGQLSYVAILPNVTAQNLLGISGAAAPTGGGPGTTVPGGGAAGAAGTIATAAGAVLGQWAVGQNFIAGVIGAVGVANAAGTSVTIGTGMPILGGAGGGGGTAASNNGGAITALANTPFLGVPASAGDGSDGCWVKPHPFIYGGTGGGASNTTTGGKGGDCGSAPGAGGGGGGGGVTTGGRGGNGGPGLVIMSSW